MKYLIGVLALTGAVWWTCMIGGGCYIIYKLLTNPDD